MLLIKTKDKKGEEIAFSFNINDSLKEESLDVTITLKRDRFIEFVKFLKKAVNN
jgi:hypothetical protein